MTLSSKTPRSSSKSTLKRCSIDQRLIKIIISLLRILLRGLGFILRTFSLSQLKRIAYILGSIFRWLHVSRRRIVYENIEQALQESHTPAQRQLIFKESYTHLVLTILETLRSVGADEIPLQAVQRVHSSSPSPSPSPSLSSVSTLKPFHLYIKGPKIHIDGREHFETLIQKGNGFILFSAHLGNWEQLIHLGRIVGVPIWIISKRFSHPLAQAAWDQTRLKSPPRLDQGSRARKILRALKNGEIIGDVLDQHDPRAKALHLSFLGRPAWTSPDLAKLSLLSGAPLLPIFTWRTSDYHVIHISPPIYPPSKYSVYSLEVERLTLSCIQMIETQIKTHPEQWMWIHRRWKTSKEYSKV